MNWNVKLREMTIKDLLTILGMIALAVFLVWKLDMVMRVLMVFFRVIQPLLLGVVFAFLLNLPMQFFFEEISREKGFFARSVIIMCSFGHHDHRFDCVSSDCG